MSAVMQEKFSTITLQFPQPVVATVGIVLNSKGILSLIGKIIYVVADHGAKSQLTAYHTCIIGVEVVITDLSQ